MTRPAHALARLGQDELDTYGHIVADRRDEVVDATGRCARAAGQQRRSHELAGHRGAT
jgi:hypothetical protein